MLWSNNQIYINIFFSFISANLKIIAKFAVYYNRPLEGAGTFNPPLKLYPEANRKYSQY